MLDRLPFYGQILVFAGLALGIVAAAYFIWPGLAETRREIEEYQQTHADKEREIQKGRLIEQKLPEFEREIANLEVKLTNVRRILPTERETGDLLRWIKNVGDSSNLDLKSFAPGGLRPAEFYKEYPIEMQLVGRYHDLGIFLDRVSKHDRIINVDNLRIGTSRAPGKTIQASLTATTFVYSGQNDG